MSKYTTEVRYICESYSGLDESKGYADINDIIANSEDQIFEEYPIFDENYRSVLNTKILRHYYTREICAETVGLWKLWLNNTMNEIMPYYNQLYRSELLKFNPLYDVEVTTSHLGNENGQSEKSEEYSKEGESEIDNLSHDNIVNTEINHKDNTLEKEENNISNENSKENLNRNENETIDRGTEKTNVNRNTNRYSDTPQGGLDGMESIEDNLYLTNATILDGNSNDIGVEKTERDTDITETNKVDKINTSNTNGNEKLISEENKNATQNKINQSNSTNTVSETNSGTTTQKFNNLNQYTERVAGKRNGMSYSALLNEFRSTFLNIDMKIIKDLENLFFKLY